MASAYYRTNIFLAYTNTGNMKFFITFALLITCALSKNIILTNDDGFASTNIRSTFRALTDAGHNVLLVAPVSQRSGWSGKFDVPPTKELQTDGDFKYRTKGEPSWGHEDDNKNIWYFNGTPASSVAFALNYVIPKYFNGSDNKDKSFDNVDLVVAGPNEGTNLSPGYFSISGTVGATTSAVYRGIPAIAFSGSNGNNSFFKDSLDEDPLEPSNIYAKKVVEFVTQLFELQGDNEKSLPLGTGINVNFPKVGYESKNESCSDPKWSFTRLTGSDATGPDVHYNESTGLVDFVTVPLKGLTACYNGDCSLPSENYILANTPCQTSVSVFSIDYDADIKLTKEVKGLLGSLL